MLRKEQMQGVHKRGSLKQVAFIVVLVEVAISRLPKHGKAPLFVHFFVFLQHSPSSFFFQILMRAKTSGFIFLKSKKQHYY